MKAVDLAEGLTEGVEAHGTDCLVALLTDAGFLYKIDSFKYEPASRTFIVRSGGHPVEAVLP